MRAALLRIAIVVMIALPARAQAQKTDKPPPPPTSGESSGGVTGAPHTRLHIAGEVVIGERAPDFELDASNGRPLRLAALRGDWVLLLFDSRKEHVSSLKKVHEEIRTLGVRPVGVCDEKAYHLESYARREQFPYPLLADPTGEISAIYGLFDNEGSTTGPGFVLLDRDGIVRMALLGQRLPPEDILRLIRFAITGL